METMIAPDGTVAQSPVAETIRKDRDVSAQRESYLRQAQEGPAVASNAGPFRVWIEGLRQFAHNGHIAGSVETVPHGTRYATLGAAQRFVDTRTGYRMARNEPESRILAWEIRDRTGKPVDSSGSRGSTKAATPIRRSQPAHRVITVSLPRP